MKALRRLSASIMASFEGVVGQLENHEAVVTAAIREAEQAAGRAKAQLAHVKRDGEALEKRVSELRQQVTLWEDRAKRSRALDEEKALECLRRRQKALGQAEKLEEQHRTHQRLERQLKGDLGTVEEKLAALRQQRNLMRTRQSRAEALKLTSEIDSSAIGHIDEIFDRWEARIISSEEQSYAIEVDSGDELTESFVSEEERKELLSILDDLTAKEESSRAK